MADFVWGANGEQLSPGAVSSRRRIAEALMAQGTSTAPLPAGTRGAGVWTQGLARVAQAMAGAYDLSQEDKAEKAADAKNRDLLLANPALGGGSPADATAAPAAVSPGVARVTAAAPSAAPAAAPSPAAAAAASVPTTDSNGTRFYNPSDSTPFEPSAADRDATIRTVYGEAANEPPVGQQAVASVIRNRAFDGGYGGDTPTAVVHAPNQFEPWNGGPALARMQALSPNDPKYAAIGKVVDAAYGTGGRAPDDPTEGKTMFYSPGAQAALGRPAPSWAKGDGQVIGGHTFYDDNSDTPAAAAPTGMTRVATALASSPDSAALPPAATPTQGYAVPGQPVAAPAATPQIPPATAGYIKQLLANPGTRQAGVTLLAQYTKPRETYSQQTDSDGNVWSVNNSTGQRTVALQGEKSTPAQKDFEYGQTHPDFVQQQLAKTKAGAAQLNNQNNVDMGSAPTYGHQLAEGLGKSHAALANGVEDAQARARDLAGMQGAVDAIQRNGGTTGGMGQQQILDLKKTINAGANAVGIDTPFNENDLSDKELLTKLNRQIAGAQAKGAVGSRVTNFDMQNYLKANAGIEMSPTANQRLIGIQAQVEQRNIAVGNAIRDATAAAIAQHKDIDPVTVQKIITDYDQAHHVQDPVTGQDLTQSYALPEFQTQGNNAALAVGHETNIGNIKIKRIN